MHGRHIDRCRAIGQPHIAAAALLAGLEHAGEFGDQRILDPRAGASTMPRPVTMDPARNTRRT